LAGERLKFRCYQCNQLLASAPGKAGSIVSCPRCKAELVVPAPDSTGPAEPRPGSVGKSSGRAATTLTQPKAPLPSNIDEIAAVIPADLADLRPEDLRVEAEFFNRLNREPEPPRDAEPFPPVAEEPAPTFPVVDLGRSAALVPAPPPEIVLPESQAQGPATPNVVPWLAAPAPAIKPNPDVPPIEIEPPSILPTDKGPRPAHEVVLPAAVVLAWSLFGLIGIATSFIAGLMIGHYFWKM
jgi:hypothetical protein